MMAPQTATNRVKDTRERTPTALDPAGRIAAAIYTLQRTTERAARAAGSRNHPDRLRNVAQRVDRARQSLENALNNLNVAIEAGEFSDNDLEAITSACEVAKNARADAQAVANTLGEIAAALTA